jgi:hypothetical protein
VTGTWRWLAALLALGLVAGGCGASAEGPGDAAATASDTPPATAGCATEGRMVSNVFEGSNAIVVDDEYLYVSRRLGVWRSPKRGGDLVKVVETTGEVQDIEVGEDRLYFVTVDGSPPWTRTLGYSPRSGGSPVHSFRAAGITGLQLAADHLYFGAYLSPGAITVSKATRDVDMTRTVVAKAGSFLVDGQTLFYASEGVTYAASLEGEAPVPLAQGAHLFIGADAGHVYSGGFAAISRIRKDGSGAEPLGMLPAYPDLDEEDLVMTVDRAFLYLADTRGAVHRMPAAGGAWTTLATRGRWDHDDSPAVIAVDGDSVYFQASVPSSNPYAIDRPMALFSVCK